METTTFAISFLIRKCKTVKTRGDTYARIICFGCNQSAVVKQLPVFVFNGEPDLIFFINTDDVEAIWINVSDSFGMKLTTTLCFTTRARNQTCYHFF